MGAEIATGYTWFNGRGSISRRGNIFLLLHSVQAGYGAHPASYTMGTEGS
jgi:hypothetical protein